MKQSPSWRNNEQATERWQETRESQFKTYLLEHCQERQKSIKIVDWFTSPGIVHQFPPSQKSTIIIYIQYNSWIKKKQSRNESIKIFFNLQSWTASQTTIAKLFCKRNKIKLKKSTLLFSEKSDPVFDKKLWKFGNQ